jgi:hypothetical protein
MAPTTTALVSDLHDLQEIRARTMYRMVEEVNIPGWNSAGEDRKMLFLTNHQATLLCSLKGAMKKLIDAFEFPNRKLVIVLNQSHGTEFECSVIGASTHGKETGYTLPFATRSEVKEAEDDMCRFMQQVIVPMAVETNAIVIVQASKGICILAQASFS